MKVWSFPPEGIYSLKVFNVKESNKDKVNSLLSDMKRAQHDTKTPIW